MERGTPVHHEATMDLFVAMRKRRMHRAFSHERVPAETIARLLWAAGRAATAKAGIRHLVLIDDPGLMRTLRYACPGFINNAPAAIAICSDLEVCRQTAGKGGVDDVSRIDAGTAAAHLSLAAPALGVGICFVTAFGAGAVRAILDLPERLRPEILIAVGIPAASPSQAMPAIPQVVHHNAFGTAWDETT
jgi:nitroreductase